VVPPLLIVATLVFDFLCIHPFRDGNGRVSRLLTTLLLQFHGFEVARYISLERGIEDTKADYYRVLKECSRGWHGGKSEILPWWNYFLGFIRNAYKDFERHVERAAARPAKSDLVRMTILDQLTEFTLADLAAELPSLSSQLIKKVLGEMKDSKKVKLSGRGRGARWNVVRRRAR
jgi:Fic family protein